MPAYTGSQSSSTGTQYVQFQPSITEETTMMYSCTFVFTDLDVLLDRGLPARCYPPITPPAVAPVYFTSMWKQQFRGHKFKLGGSKK